MPLMTVLLFATSLICCQLQRPSHWCDILFTLHSVPANRCATRKSFGILGKVDIFCVITCMSMMCTQLNWGVHYGAFNFVFFAPVKRLPWSIEVSGLEFYQMSCKCRQAVLLQLYAWLNIYIYIINYGILYSSLPWSVLFFNRTGCSFLFVSQGRKLHRVCMDLDCMYLIVFVCDVYVNDRRKFGSPDIMDRWSSRGGKSQRRERRIKKIREENESEERRCRCARRWTKTRCFSSVLWLRRVEK